MRNTQISNHGLLWSSRLARGRRRRDFLLVNDITGVAMSLALASQYGHSTGILLCTEYEDTEFEQKRFWIVTFRESPFIYLGPSIIPKFQLSKPAKVGASGHIQEKEAELMSGSLLKSLGSPEVKENSAEPLAEAGIFSQFLKLYLAADYCMFIWESYQLGFVRGLGVPPPGDILRCGRLTL